MKKTFWLWLACLLIPSGISLAQTKSQLMSVPTATAARASWDSSLGGKWTYRSYLNRADIIINDDLISLAQTKSQLMSVPTATAARASWDSSLGGKWTYRSYLNRADIIINDDP